MFKRNWFLQAPDDINSSGGTGEVKTPVVGEVKTPVVGEVKTPVVGEVKTPVVDGKGDWPTGWRELVSKDPKHQKTLERFAAPTDIWNSYEALRQRLSSGELKAVNPFPAKGTPEEQAAWRTENNIPAAPEKYELKFADGLVVGEADKPIVDSFLKAAHAANMPPELATTAVGWYFKHQSERQKANEIAFDENKKKTEDQLRAEWGGDYRANQNLIGGLLDGYVGRDSPMYQLIARAIETNGEYARFMARMAREINPVHAIVPGEGGNVASRVDDEIKTIEERMRKDRSGYNKDTAQQHRYRELLTAKAKFKA